ncbi:MAG: hypothetical protein AAGG68_30750, partial [Bacteroidota bacterium]
MSSGYKKKNFNLFWLIVCFAISPFLFLAQTERYSFHHLTTDDGLSQASNDFIYHDSQGFVWLSSIDGLNRFDGKDVKIYKSISGDSTSLLGNIITSNFFEDEFTNIWFTTYEGLHCYIRANDHFKHFRLEDQSEKVISQNYYAFYLDNKGQLWINMSVNELNKLYLFDPHSLEFQYYKESSGYRNYAIENYDGEIAQIISAVFDNTTGIEVWDLDSSNSNLYFNTAKGKFP